MGVGEMGVGEMGVGEMGGGEIGEGGEREEEGEADDWSSVVRDLKRARSWSSWADSSVSPCTSSSAACGLLVGLGETGLKLRSV